MSSSPAELRPLTPGDAGAVAELMRELEADLALRVATADDDVRDWWLPVELPSDSWAVVSEGRVDAAGWIFVRDGAAWQHGLVRPSERGRGHGNRLLGLAEQRLQELGLSALEATAFGADRAAEQLFLGRGYVATRRYLELELELTAAPTTAVPSGVRIEPFRAEDARVFHATIDAAFAENWDFVSTPFEQWYELRVVNGDMSFSFVAWDGERVAGAIRCDPERRGLGWIAALGVLPEWRGRGVGRALLVRAFRAFWDAGRPRIGLGVAGDNVRALGLYESLGMRAEAEDVVYRKSLA